MRRHDMIDFPHSDCDTLGPSVLVEHVHRSARGGLGVSAALDRIRLAPTILAAMQSLPDALRSVDRMVLAGLTAESLLAPLLHAIDDERDTLAALAAVHMLGRVPGPGADIELAALVLDGVPGFEAHAAWATTGRPFAPELMGPLSGAVAGGGMPGFHAQATLARWAAQAPQLVLTALESALTRATGPDARRYLTETIGLLPSRRAGLVLERIATDPREETPVRAAAVVGFTERISELIPHGVARLTHSDDELGQVARSIRTQRLLRQRGPWRQEGTEEGVRIAQIHLAAVLDPSTSRAGVGDAGGVATLLAQLSGTLVQQRHIREVVSVGRGLPGELVQSSRAQAGCRHEGVPLAREEGATFSGRWPSLVAAVRGVRSAFLAGFVPDVVHLRMADPGSLAGAMVAQQLGVPFVFTLAPDPHGPIATAEAGGSLDRASFAAQDAREALWYRADLVGRLARGAQELVLFPRPHLKERLRELTGVEIGTGPLRHTVVAEGIDLVRSDRAGRTVADSTAMPPVVGDLQRAISQMPVARHGLPLVISVGRMHQVKGMARLVKAFATDESLWDRANLVIIGGDLAQPTASEAAELSRIGALFDANPGLADRVILMGHRPNDEVGLLLAVAQAGWGSLIGARGAYACGSAKEEFGLAIIEAMAAGLPVVAPRNGGPSTYVADGSTGWLVDTTDVAALAGAIRASLQLAEDPEAARRTRAVVEKRFTLDRMARTLAAVYRSTAARSTRTLPGDVRVGRAA